MGKGKEKKRDKGHEEAIVRKTKLSEKRESGGVALYAFGTCICMCLARLVRYVWSSLVRLVRYRQDACACTWACRGTLWSNWSTYLLGFRVDEPRLK
jgi:hypothetical protein